MPRGLSQPLTPPSRGGNQSDLHKSLVGAVREYVQWIPGWCLKYFAGGLGAKKGMPDFIAAVPIPGTPFAAFVGIECKTGNAELNPDQVKVRRELQKAQVLYLEVRSVDDLEAGLLKAGLLDAPRLQQQTMRYGG